MRDGSEGPRHGAEPFAPPVRESPWRGAVVPAALFALTLLSTLFAGALQRGFPPDAILARPSLLAAGLPYSLTLLLILGAHEMGHYVAARRWGMAASLPWFLPAPSLLGTFGAIIRMRGRIRNRNALMDVAVSGPLAGVAVAAPAVAVGLALSARVPEGGAGGVRLGTPLLFDGVAWLVHGPIPPGQDILLHPVAFAGWCGLLVTSLNLMPAGQLDGGHIAYALLGRRGARASIVVGLVLLGMGYWWPGWIFWGALKLLWGGRHPPLAEEGAPLARARRFWGLGCMMLLALTFTLAPIRLF